MKPSPSGIEIWFDRFIGEHLARHPRTGLFAADSDQGIVAYATWRKLLGQINGIDYATATAASERLVVEPAADKKHFTALVAFAKEAIRDRKPEGKRHDLSSRDGAEAASRGCDRCTGHGLVIVFHEDSAHRPPSAGAHCVCSMGRWMRKWFADRNDRVTLQGVIDLDEVIRGLSPWLEEPPTGEPRPRRPSTSKGNGPF